MKKIQYNGISKLLSGIVSKINNLIDIVEMKADWEQTDPTAFDYIKNKPDSLDEKVKQENTTSDEDYRVLLSKSANDITEIDKTWKNSDLKYNPSTGNLTAVRLNGNEIGNDPQFTDTTYENKAAVQGGSAESLVTTGEKYNWNTAHAHSQLTSGNPHNVTKSDVGLGNVPNVATDNQTPTVTEATQRDNIANGDNLKTIIGKIKKFFTDLKTVAFTGSYNDLTDKPTIPSEQIQSDWEQDDDSEVDYIKHKPTLADVATSGDYSDLINTPTIPTVNNAKLTINQNGTLAGEFTANASSPETINLTDTTYTASGVVSIDANNNITSTAEVNQNTFAKVKVGNTTITADAKQDTLELYAGNNITLTPDATNDKVTIDATGIPTKTSDLINDSNFVSDANYVHTDVNFTSAYETKLSGIEPNAQVNTVTGVKGSSETDYRTGNISISKSDVGLGNVPNVTTNNQKPTFTQASTRANLVSNTDTLSTIMGKIMKWFDDLKDLAFIAKDGTSSTKYLRGDGTWQTFPTIPNITDTYSGTSHDGMSGVAVKSAIDALDGNLNNTTPGAGKTLTAFSQTDGKVSAKFENISISKSQAGLGNVDNTSDATKKTNFTGSIASGNTGFVTGGDIYTALQGKADTGDIPTDFVKASTGGTFSGNITVAKSHTGTTDNQTILTVGNNKTSTGMSSGALKLFSERGTGKFIRLFNDNTLTGSSADRRYKLPVDKPNDSELAVVADIPTQASDIGALPSTTKYAGSSTVGGVATSAAKLSNTSKVGDTNRPVYFTANGVPAQISYTIDKSVPSTAVFTDTTYTFAGGTDKFTVTPSGGSAQTVNIANGGVRNVETGTAFGSLSVNTGGTSADKVINMNAPQQALGGLDLNNYTESGIYYFKSTTTPPYTNMPNSTNGILIVIRADWDARPYVKQIWLRHGTNNTNDHNTYIRSCSNISSGAWSNWHRLSTTGSFYGTCSTAATEQNKVATINGNLGFVLEIGTVVGIKFTNTNTYSATTDAPVTLNVNDTGAKSIYYNNSATPTGTNTKAFGYANRINYYMYDGTYWVFLSASVDDNTTYSTMAANEVYTGTVTTAKIATAARLNTDIKKLIADALEWKEGSSLYQGSTGTVLCNKCLEINIEFKVGGYRYTFFSPVSTLYASDSSNGEYIISRQGASNSKTYITFRLWMNDNKVKGRVVDYVVNDVIEPFPGAEVYYR